jgi:hypothetical protein
MSPRKKPKISAEKWRELQVAAAVARESMLQTHVTRALELIELAGNNVSVIRMLEIYTRVAALSRTDAEVVANRLLAVIGRRAGKTETPAVYVEGEDEVPSEKRLFGAMRDRLKGRRMHELRRLVELHSGSTQAAILDIHVRHAKRFVEALAESHSIAEALQVYAELIEVPRNLTEALYIYVVDRIATEALPRATAQLAQDNEQVPLFPPQRRPKRAG